MGLDSILSKIESDASTEISRIESGSREQVLEITRAAESRGKTLAMDIARTARAAAEEQAKRVLTLAGLDARRHDLEVKQRLVAKAFEEAASRLQGVPDGEYQALVREMLLGAVKTGGEEVIVSPRDRSRLAPCISEANKQRVASGKKGNLKMASSTRDMLGGFILVEGKVETNNTFDVALRLKRDELEPEVAAVLFGESSGAQG